MRRSGNYKLSNFFQSFPDPLLLVNYGALLVVWLAAAVITHCWISPWRLCGIIILHHQQKLCLLVCTSDHPTVKVSFLISFITNVENLFKCESNFHWMLSITFTWKVLEYWSCQRIGCALQIRQDSSKYSYPISIQLSHIIDEWLGSPCFVIVCSSMYMQWATKITWCVPTFRLFRWVKHRDGNLILTVDNIWIIDLRNPKNFYNLYWPKKVEISLGKWASNFQPCK